MVMLMDPAFELSAPKRKPLDSPAVTIMFLIPRISLRATAASCSITSRVSSRVVPRGRAALTVMESSVIGGAKTMFMRGVNARERARMAATSRRVSRRWCSAAVSAAR